MTQLISLLLDVSGSMEAPFTKCSVQNGPKSQTIFTLIRLLLDSEFLSSASVFALVFGGKSWNYKDLLPILDQFTTLIDKYGWPLPSMISYDPTPSKKYRSLLIELAHHSGAPYIDKFLKDVDLRKCEFFYKTLSRNATLREKVVKNLPDCVKSSQDNQVDDHDLSEANTPLCREVLLYSKPVNTISYVFTQSFNINPSTIHRLQRAACYLAPSLTHEVVQKEVDEAFDICTKPYCADISTVSSHPSIRPAQEVLTTINHLFDLTKEEPTLSPVHDEVYGLTPLHATLTEALDTYKAHPEAETRLMVIVSDGNSTDKPSAAVTKLMLDNRDQLNLFVACCFLSMDDHPSRVLLDKKPSWMRSAGAVSLFEMASTLTTDSPPFQILRRRGWTLPSSGEAKLFVQVNNEEHLNEFVEAIREIEQSNDAIIDMFGHSELHSIITKSITTFTPTNQGNMSICWAHSCATVIHLALARIIGRPLKSFETIRADLLSRFDASGQNTYNVLRSVVRDYKLHFKEVDEEGARLAVLAGRPCVARFYGSALWWEKWDTWFKTTETDPSKRTQPLTAELLEAQPCGPLSPSSSPSGHAVVLVRCSATHLTFLNSWGADWNDHGLFHVRRTTDLPRMRFFDVFWYENDLSDEEKAAYAQAMREKLVERVGDDPHAKKALRNQSVLCAKCGESSPAREFEGNLVECQCPKCHMKFQPSVTCLRQSLWLSDESR